MRNCGRQGRSRNLMLVANLRPKVVLPHGSRLLLGLIVRARGRLVDGEQILGAIETRPPGPALSERGPHSGHPRPVAPLSQRAGLLEIRPLPPAALLPLLGEPEPAQPPYPRPGARAASAAGRACRHALRALGSLSGDGHHPDPGYRESESSPGGDCSSVRRASGDAVRRANNGSTASRWRS